MAKKGVVSIKLEDLRREVDELRQEYEKNRILTNPQLRIGDIMVMMRRYKEAVVKASSPRDFKPGSEVDPKQARRLRDHRQMHADIAHSEIGLKPLRQSLETLNCQFLLRKETWWRVNDADWERNVWKPLYEWVEQGYELLFREGQSHKTVHAQELRNWDDKELKLEQQLMARMIEFMPENDDPVIDEGSLGVRWRGEVCELGNNQLYSLMKCLINVKGRYVHYGTISEALGDNANMTSAAIHKNVERLKAKLRDSPCARLADAIDASQKEYIRLDLVKLRTDSLIDEGLKTLLAQSKKDTLRKKPRTSS